MSVPLWIDEMAASFHPAFRDMMPCDWGPLDEFALMSCLNGTLICRVHEAMRNVPLEKGAKKFFSPSTIRVAIYFLALEYMGWKQKDKRMFKEVVEYLVACLKLRTRRDAFAREINIAHSEIEIDELLASTKFHGGEPQRARGLGKLYSSASAIVYARYRDFFPHLGCEVYGPYDVSHRFGEGHSLVVKQFRDLSMDSRGPDTLRIMQVFKGVRFSCQIIGQHSLYEGDLINGLVAFSADADGTPLAPEEIRALADRLAQIATDDSVRYDTMGEKENKERFLRWSCLQFKELFAAAGMDWRPTVKMEESIAHAHVASRFVMDRFPEYGAYVTSEDFEIFWLKSLYG